MKTKKLLSLFSVLVLFSSVNAGIIQNAINSASSGDTVIIPAGTYNETVIINKPLTLDGGGVATINGSSGIGTLISIQSSDVTVQGFTLTNIKGYGISTKDLEGGYSNIVLKNNVINNISNITTAGTNEYPSGVGIYVGYMSGFFVYNPSLGTYDKSSSNILDYKGLSIVNNTISTVANGIALQSVKSTDARLQLSGNAISNMNSNANGATIWLDNARNVDISNNNLSNGYHGVNITSYAFNLPWKEYIVSNGSTVSSDINIINNTISNMVKTSWYDGNGIDIYGGDVESINIQNNTFTANGNHDILGAYIGEYPVYAETGNSFDGDSVVEVKYMSDPRDGNWVDTTGDNGSVWTTGLIANGCLYGPIDGAYYPEIHFNLPLSEIDMSPMAGSDLTLLSDGYRDDTNGYEPLYYRLFQFKRKGSNDIINYTIDTNFPVCP